MTLAKKLKEARENAGLSQNEVAEKLNISRQAVSKWENGWTSPDIDNLVILSDLYNISLDKLLKTEYHNPDDMDVNLNDKAEQDEKKLFGIFLEEIGILIIVMCLSAIPCLGFVGITLLLSYYIVVKKYKIKMLYKVILLFFVLISVYNSVKYISIEFLDMGKATIERVALLMEG